MVLKLLKAIKKTKNLSKSGKLSEVRIDYLSIITHNVNHDCNFEVLKSRLAYVTVFSKNKISTWGRPKNIRLILVRYSNSDLNTMGI